MAHPFADLIALQTDETRAGHSRLSLTVGPTHLNPHQVVHGAVVYAIFKPRQP
jgi:acyl-CoA thioesterase